VVPLALGPDDAVTWSYRHGEEPGTGTRLLDGVTRLAADTGGLYAFGAAESRQITAVRRHLRHERHLPAHQVQMTGYWRRNRAG
jgi:NADPH-dependent ferric siderophore reductase